VGSPSKHFFEQIISSVPPYIHIIDGSAGTILLIWVLKAEMAEDFAALLRQFFVLGIADLVNNLFGALLIIIFVLWDHMHEIILINKAGVSVRFLDIFVDSPLNFGN
jgi:hypothetical protein